MGRSLRMFLDKLSVLHKLLTEALLSLSFTLLLLNFIVVVHPSSVSAHIDIIRDIDRLLVELDIEGLLVAQSDRLLQVEMNYSDQLILFAGLEEAMFDI